MRNSRRVCAAVFIAAACIVICDVASAGSSEDGRDGARFVFFSGTDFWRQGGFAHGGLLWSPAGLDNEGFTLKAVISGGAYRYQSGALGDATVSGREFGAQLLPGWRFKRDTLEIKVFAGPEIREHRLSPDDPSASLRGRVAGLRTGVDLWYQPTAASMVAADASFSSIANGYSARAAFGWRVFDKFYLGPEAATFGCDDYRQYRLGIHATAFMTGNFEWSAAAGFARDSDRNNGVYGRLGLLMRR